MMGRDIRVRRVLLATVGAAGIAVAGTGVGVGPAAAAAGSTFHETRLVSDVPGAAELTDPLVKNPWGIALSATSPLWVANNGTSTATLYTGANGVSPVAKVPLTVTTPEAPTGQVFNKRALSDPSAFVVRTGGVKGPATFLFDSLGGQLAGWTRSTPPGQHAQNVKRIPGAVYTGLAEATVSGGRTRLYAANAGPGASVDVFDSHFNKISSFNDPTLPGLTPYNVAVLNGKLYVSYAPPPGSTATTLGAVDVFSVYGTKMQRLITGGPLNGPWAMVVAPQGWGSFGGDLLVGNEDGGNINAFDPTTGAFVGTITASSGQPFAEDGLWGLAFGNGTFGTTHSLIFAAGVNHYQDGLVGLIEPDAG